MAEPTIAYIGLGSNLGDRQRSIRDALDLLGKDANIEVTRVSDMKETPPLGPLPQPDYSNGVAKIKTTLKPGELLAALKAVEDALHRERRGKWTARTIDLDLLLFGQESINTPDLIVPHRQMHLRSFVLHGLCQLDPDMVHPLLEERISVLAARLNGADYVLNPDVPQLVSVAGIIGVGKTTLAKQLVAALEAEILLEPYDTNPYMPEVYAGRKELALDSQLYFLVNRAGQLGREALSSYKIFLTDYIFDKELIYARCLLNGHQLRLYENIYQVFVERVAPPILVIYLQDSPAHCLERIHRRNRPYEQDITLEFLESLDSDYERLFDDWRVCPVIRMAAPALCAGDEATVERVATQVKAYVAPREEMAVR